MHPTAGSFGTYAEIYLNPWAGFMVPLLLLDGAGDRGRRRGGGGRRVHDFLVSRHAGVAVVAGLRLGAAVFQLAVGATISARSNTGSRSSRWWRSSCSSSSGLATHLRALDARPSGFHNLTGLPGGFMPHGLRRRVDGGDRRDLVVQRHRSHRRDLGRGEGPGAHDSGGAAQHGAAAVPVLHPGARHRRHLRALDRDRRHGRRRRVRSCASSRIPASATPPAS